MSITGCQQNQGMVRPPISGGPLPLSLGFYSKMNELRKFREGNRKVRHYLFVKWMLILFLLTVATFWIGYYTGSKITYYIMAFLILGANILSFLAAKNFFSKAAPPEEEFKRVKQPWE